MRRAQLPGLTNSSSSDSSFDEEGEAHCCHSNEPQRSTLIFELEQPLSVIECLDSTQRNSSPQPENEDELPVIVNQTPSHIQFRAQSTLRGDKRGNYSSSASQDIYPKSSTSCSTSDRKYEMKESPDNHDLIGPLTVNFETSSYTTDTSLTHFGSRYPHHFDEENNDGISTSSMYSSSSDMFSLPNLFTLNSMHSGISSTKHEKYRGTRRSLLFYCFQVASLLLCGVCLYSLVESIIALSEPYNRGRKPIEEHDLLSELESSWKLFDSSFPPPMHVTNFSLNNPSLCKEPPYFMVLVHSAPSHFKERQVIRDTWGSLKWTPNKKSYAPSKQIRRPIQLGFLLGLSNESYTMGSVHKEFRIYKDIILSSQFFDSYKNLTIKHLMGYQWALTHCPNATYILKTDDDAFLDIHQLYNYVERTYGGQNGTLLCNVFPQGTQPVRDAASKWYVTKDEYGLELYPKYCGGLAYLITPDVIRRLYDEAIGRSKHLWVDDVFVTGVLRELAHVDPYYLNLRYTYDPSKYRKWLEDEKLRQPPFIFAHVEKGRHFFKEMKQLWSKTLRAWHHSNM